jgi:hypothetical protein
VRVYSGFCRRTNELHASGSGFALRGISCGPTVKIFHINKAIAGANIAKENNGEEHQEQRLHALQVAVFAREKEKKEN